MDKDRQAKLAAAISAIITAAVMAILALIFVAPEDPAVVVQPGASVKDAINSSAQNGIVYLASGNHSNLDFADYDGKGVTVSCQDGAVVARFKLQRVTNLKLASCKMSPLPTDVGVYISGGGGIRVEGMTITGGERGVLVQASNKADRSTWTVGAVITNNVITKPVKEDGMAVYGGQGIEFSGNTVSMSTDGCNVAHEDGFQGNGTMDVKVLNNRISNNGKAPPNMKCPDGSYPHDQGIIFTQPAAGDVAENILVQGNEIVNWFAGLAGLVDGKNTKNVVLDDTNFHCSSKSTWKLTGDVSQISEQGTTATPCGTPALQDIEPAATEIPTP